LGFLAKIYKIFITEEEKLIKLFYRNGVFKNETKAVKNFVQKLRKENIVIIDGKNTQKGQFWQLLRHGLVHLFFPKGASSVAAVDPTHFAAGLNLFQFRNSLSSDNKPAITKNERGGFCCNADLLAVKTQKAANWLISYIDGVTFSDIHQEAIKKLLGITERNK